MGTIAGLASTAANTCTAPAVPWWGILLVGVSAVLLGIAIAWGHRQKKISLDETFDFILGYLGYVFILGGLVIMVLSVDPSALN